MILESCAIHVTWNLRQRSEMPVNRRFAYSQIMTESLQALATAHHLSIPQGESDALERALPGWPPFPDVRPALKRLKPVMEACR